MAQFAVQLTSGETVYINEADAYQFEGPLTTFFSTGSSRQVIDSWSTRVASYRTNDVRAIERFDLVLPMEQGIAVGPDQSDLTDSNQADSNHHQVDLIDIRTSAGLSLVAS